jgi:hypothetical protein
MPSLFLKQRRESGVQLVDKCLVDIADTAEEPTVGVDELTGGFDDALTRDSLDTRWLLVIVADEAVEEIAIGIPAVAFDQPSAHPSGDDRGRTVARLRPPRR